ncbi:uncharacterized protein EDB93DRAFT_188550 [Suillus bovinus]|uniref:uncharacterized protein n=1 Tax=Suillus bovinus TaxID=48563 RepID=UPI001B87FF3D|nr:uncharacterized protein EDB93DRAFT_188550 [Suillus bovinus]KAG2154202.1 hypothetical protein EDB93DRAFT_188550 [Suillus bovinus]
MTKLGFHYMTTSSVQLCRSRPVLVNCIRVRSTGSSNSSPSVAMSAYGFLLISVAALCIITLCCFVRCRPGVFIDTSWDTTEQLDGRVRRRRKLVPPVLWDTWLTRPPSPTEEVLGVGQFEWSNIQPVYVSLIYACQSRPARQFAVAESEVPADRSTVAQLLPHSSSSLPLPPRRRFTFPLVHTFNFHMWPRRRSHTHHISTSSEKPIDNETENHPEAVQIAVMISMPSSASRCWNHAGGPSCHSTGPDDALWEYQFGVAQIPWIT